ncbi:hypothetical protein ACX35X_001700 [Enterococcus hirae]
MNTRIKREEVATLLIKDKFFAKGNRRLKIKQWIVAILGWCGVIFPFIWVNYFVSGFNERERITMAFVSGRTKNVFFFVAIFSGCFFRLCSFILIHDSLE